MQILPKCYPNRVGFLAFVRRRARAAAASHETIVRLSAYSIYIITRVIFKAIAGITLVQYVECGYNFRAKDRRRRLHVVGAVRAARREAHHRRRRNRGGRSRRRRGGRRGCRCRNHRCRRMRDGRRRSRRCSRRLGKGARARRLRLRRRAHLLTSRHRIRREIDISRRTLGVSGRLKSQVPQLLPNQELRKLEHKTQDDHPGGELVASLLVLWVRALCVSFRPHDEPDHVEPKRPPKTQRRVLQSRVTRKNIAVSLPSRVHSPSLPNAQSSSAPSIIGHHPRVPSYRVPSPPHPPRRTFNKALFCVSIAAIPNADNATIAAQYPVPCHPSVPRSAHPNCACNSAFAATSRVSRDPGHILANRDAMVRSRRPSARAV